MHIARRHPQASYYLLLAAAVAVLFFAVQAYALAVGKDLIWQTDPKPQYINFLMWGVNALGEMASTLQEGGGLVFPLYTYSLGYGADAIVSMGSYLQDPVNIIFALFPRELLWISYPLMTYVRMYLAAVAFSIYCFGRGHGRRAVGVASLLYVTCGFVLYLGVIRHAKFIDWAILLPLLLRAADLLFEGRGRGKAMFVAVLFFQFFTSVYYLYMSCLVLLAYCLAKYFLVPRERGIADFAKLVALFAGLGILAFLLAGVFTIPQVMGLLSQGRVTSNANEVAILFPLTYYFRIPVHLIGADGNTEGMIMCCVATLAVLVFALCRKRFEPGQWRVWMLAAIVCLLGLVFPYFGHVMNGMGYSTDRWMLLLGFVSAYIMCLVFPQLANLDGREWRRVGIAVAFFVAAAVLYAALMFVRDGTLDLVIWPIIMAVAFVAAFGILRRALRPGAPTRNAAVVCVAIVACASLSTGIYFSSLGVHWIGGYSKHDAIVNALTNSSPAVAVQKTGDDGLYRYSEPRVQKTKNSALIHEPTMGVDFYTSYYNQAVDDFRQELGISDHHMNFSFCGSGSRLAIEDLTGVKYYVAAKGDAWRVPYGFTDTGITHKKMKVYENPNPVPLAFLADGVVDYAEYEGLTMTQREEALLQGAVVDADDVSVGVKRVQPEFASQELSYTISDQDGVRIEDGVFHVIQPGATVTLEFTGLPDSETYLSFENLDYDGYSPSKRVQMQGEEVGKRQVFGDLFWSERTEYPITATAGKRTATFEPVTARHRRFGGKVNWVLNMGYAADPVTKMTLTFDYMGDYSFDALKVVCQPVEPIVEDAAQLAAQGLDGLEMHRNGMSATAVLESDDPRIAVFTVAYGTGWSVKVDGEPAKALKVDTGFLGVELSGAGAHSIEWSYETPGLRTGAYMTLAGLVVLAVVGALAMRRRSRRG